MSRDENQNYRDYSISSPASLSPGPYSPYSPEPPASPDAKRTPGSAKRYPNAPCVLGSRYRGLVLFDQQAVEKACLFSLSKHTNIKKQG